MFKNGKMDNCVVKHNVMAIKGNKEADLVGAIRDHQKILKYNKFMHGLKLLILEMQLYGVPSAA